MLVQCNDRGVSIGDGAVRLALVVMYLVVSHGGQFSGDGTAPHSAASGPASGSRLGTREGQ